LDELKKADKAISRILTKPPDDPIWHNEDFWGNRWPLMVDRYAEANESIGRKA
jgi:hypothetical protein